MGKVRLILAGAAVFFLHAEAWATSQPLFRIVAPLREDAPIKVSEDARAALIEAGCGESSGGAREVTIAASLAPTKPLPVCTLAVEVAEPAGGVFYAAPKVVEGVNCSPAWVAKRVREHVQAICEKALLLAEVEASRRAATELAGRNAELEARLGAKPNSSVPLATAAPNPSMAWERGQAAAASALLVGGIGSIAWGGYLLSRNGDRGDCPPQRCVYDNNTRATVFIGLGGVAVAAGGWWLWHLYSERSKASLLVGPGSVALTGSF